MDKSKVALIRCEEYEEPAVANAIKRGIELLGGISSFVKEKEKIILKPNVLLGIDPNKHVTTHPLVFIAVARLLQNQGVDVYYGDSSGFGSCESNMTRAKLKSVADEIGIRMADFDQGQQISHPAALLVKQFILAKGVVDADGLISLPKLKTHGLTRLTGAVKNQFGCIPGLLKSQFHLRLPDPYDFATMLVDINTFIKPRLYVMDGIIGMEGNGPRNGKPHKMNVLLFSTDPIALDAVACKIINLDPEMVPTSKPGEQAGLGTYHYNRIEIVGDKVQSFVDEDFDVVHEAPVSTDRSRFWTFFKNQVCPRPVINKNVCTGCGTCLKVCPADPKAIDWKTNGTGKFPGYNYNLCLRCFCCQEMCPEGAITINNPPLSKLISRRSRSFVK
jgi:uncharacterized protein (DUF362 family)/NAD-dependent dihydropyrimidine dehydrogenase PreA subunit